MKSLTNYRKSLSDSAIVATLNGCSFIAAFLVDILIATQFGLGREADAFFLALAIPLFIYSVTLVSVNVVLVPLFSEALVKYDTDFCFTAHK